MALWMFWRETGHLFSVFFSLVFLPTCSSLGLQTTRLGNHLEDRVNKFLRRQNHPEAGEVFVRVVASSDKTVEVKPGMKSRLVPEGLF